MSETTRPDFYSMHARKLLGMPEEWRWFKLEAKDGGAGRSFIAITGAIPLKTFASGPRKGETNWAHRKDEREIIISDEEHRRFIADWERETGLCSQCGGSGQELASVGVHGRTFRPCTRCAKARAAAEGCA